MTYPISGTPIANGTSILIERILPLVQSTSLTNIGAYSPTAVEGALDQLEMQIQQVATDVELAPQAPPNYTGHVPVLQPPFTSGQSLAYNSNGDIVAGGGSGGGGGGGVTSVGTGTGLTGGPVTTSGTISIAPSAANTLAGFGNSGTFGDVSVGAGLTLSGGTLTATGAVTSVSNSDGTLTVSPTSGAVVASLAALPNANILVGSGANKATAVGVSGDATLSNTGALTVTKTNNVAFGTMATQNASAVTITGGTVTGMPQPSSGSDVANKTYVDNAVSGTTQKAACLSINTTSLTVNYSNGASGVGATLTNSSTLVQFTTSDGVTPNTNSRILMAGQSGATFQNGSYTVTNQGSGAVAWVLTRTTDFNTSANITYGSNFLITSGTVYTGATFIESAPGPFTVGTTPITFVQSQGAAQTITLTGPVTGTGAGSISTAISNNAVTTAMVQNNAITPALMSTSSANTLAGYSGIGAFVDVNIGTGLTLSGNTLASTSAVASVSNSDGSITISPTTGAVVASIATSGVNTTQLANYAVLSSKVNTSAITSATIAANAVTFAKLQTSTANTLAGFDGSSNFADITLNANPGLVVASSTIGINATIYNVKDYGAKGDGSTNDNTAIAAAIAACVASTWGGVVYFPQGIYVVTQQFTATTTTGSPRSVYFKGDGPNVSIIQWTTATGGIAVTFNSGKFDKGYVGAEGLTFYTKTVNGGTALSLTSATTPNPGPIKRIFNCSFVGDNATTYWTNGILMDAITYDSVVNCEFQGISSANSGIGVAYQNSQNGTDANDAVAHHINNCFFWALNYGVSAVAGPGSGTGIEGIEITNCDMICNVGVNWNDNNGRPELSVTGCQIAGVTYCIQTQDVTQMNIANNLFYNGSTAGSTWIGIYVNNNATYSTNDNNLISDNTFECFGAAQGAAAIALLDAQYNKVTGNRIDNAITGIWLKAGTTNCIVKGNYITNFTTAILDSGTANLALSDLAGYGALVHLSGNMSIANVTNTPISWNLATYDPLTLWDGVTKFIIPNGVSRVKLVGNIVWATNTSGDRNVFIQKNGSGFVGTGNVNGPPGIVSGACSQYVATAVVTVSSGDYFTLVVAQGSGGNLNVNNANSTMFSIEIVG